MKRDSKEEKDSAAEDSQPSVPSTLEQRCQGRRVIVVLQRVRTMEQVGYANVHFRFTFSVKCLGSVDCF